MFADNFVASILSAWVISVVTLTEIADGKGSAANRKDFHSANEGEGELDVHDPKFFVSHIFEKYGDRNVLTYEGFEHLLENLGLGRLNFEKGHDVSIHKVNGSFYDIHDEKELHKHWHDHQKHDEKLQRSKRHSAPTSQQSKEIEDEACLSPQEILLSYGIQPSHGVVISPDSFQLLCPAIVYELDQKHCWHEVSSQGNSVSTRPQLQVWLEAGTAILIMSVAGILCAAIVPILNRCDNDGTFLQFLVAIAAGTLTGDAVIHLLPQVLSRRYPSEPASAAILRGTTCLLSILLFYIMESTLLLIYKSRTKQIEDEESSTEARKMIKHTHSHSHSGKRKGGPLACMVIAGDILHNVTDGLSVGAAFSMSSGAGLACATAVFCHELPHELGDYAVLLREGMRIRRALLCNLFSSIFSFIGMSAGILLGEYMDATPWVNAFTAGTFLYIALANLVPELKANNSIGGMISQLIGLLSGIFLMFLIALYENDWEDFLTS